MKPLIIILTMLASSSILFAQQIQNTSLPELQGIFHNPSLAGVDKENKIGMSYRSEWSGFTGSPNTATVFGSFAMPQHEMGMSGYVYSDNTGPTSITGAQIAIAKHLVFADKSVLSFGIEGRILQFSIDKVKLTQTLGTDPVLGANTNSLKLDAGFGVSYTNARFQIGAAASQLTQSKLDFYSGNLTRSETAKLYRHYYVHGNYKFDLDSKTTLTPNFLLTYLPNAPSEFSFGAIVDYDQLVSFGLGYRLNQGPMFNAGLHITPKFSVGLGFDVYNAPLSAFTNGNKAYEFILKYKL